MIESHAYRLSENVLDELPDQIKGRHTLLRLEETESLVTLLDSFDSRFHKAQIELHYSREQIRWVGSEPHPSLRPLTLPETPAFAGDFPPGPWREAIEERLGIRRLLEVVSWKRRETPLRVLDRREKTVVRGQLVSIDTGNRTTRILRIQSVRGYDEAYRMVRSVLEQIGAEPSDESEGQIAAAGAGHPLGKYTHRLGLQLHPGMRSDLALRLIHARLLNIALANVPGLRAHLDVEFLHDFRVAFRKTRTALAQVRDVFPEAIVGHFKEELRWLFRETGYARDLDVFLLAIPGYQDLLSAASRPHLAPLQEFLESQREQEQQRLDKLLGSRRIRHLLTDWSDYLESELPTDDAPKQAMTPIETVARKTVKRLWKRVLRDGGRIEADTPDAALHDLRVRIKKLRYALEFFCQVLTEEVDSAIRETKRLQDNLGRFADYSTQRSQLQRFAEDLSAVRAVSPSTLLAMGQLIPQFDAGQALERQLFHRTFDRFSSKNNQQMMTRILE